jgi:hypothetical protein
MRGEALGIRRGNTGQNGLCQTRNSLNPKLRERASAVKSWFELSTSCRTAYSSLCETMGGSRGFQEFTRRRLMAKSAEWGA